MEVQREVEDDLYNQLSVPGKGESWDGFTALLATIDVKLEKTRKLRGRLQSIFSGTMGASAAFSTLKNHIQRIAPTATDKTTIGWPHGHTFPPVLKPRMRRAVEISYFLVSFI